VRLLRQAGNCYHAYCMAVHMSLCSMPPLTRVLPSCPPAATSCLLLQVSNYPHVLPDVGVGSRPQYGHWAKPTTIPQPQ
jgi:hypothetical protein